VSHIHVTLSMYIYYSLSRGVRGPVWIDFEVKNQPIQNKNHVRFGSV